MRDTTLFGGGAVNSCGSMSTLLMSSEDSSSPYPEEDESSELELCLGLSLGRAGGIGNAKVNPADGGAGSWEQYARILTAKEFQSRISTKAPSSSSSSSSSSPVIQTNINSIGSKRTAEPSSLSALSSQVRGWPPIATHRINSLVNHTKSPVNEESASNVDNHIITTIGMDKINYSSYRNNNVSKERGPLKTSLFVKVNMDGISIGRKVDLHAHSCYETLAQTLDHMFTLDAVAGARRSNVEEQALMGGRGQPMRLLDSSSDFVLTYENKEGDWMLVGDVPWEMFLSSVRRLRIRRTAEANGLAPRSRGRN